MERNCDTNQNICDTRDVNCDNKKKQNPSLVHVLSAILPSNFLNLSPRWRDWFMRGQSGLLLMSSFYLLVKLGPLGLFTLTLTVQFSSFYEVMRLGYQITKVENMKSWTWLLYLLGNFYFLHPSLASGLPLTERGRVAVSFSAYLLLITWFVLSIRHQSDCLPRYGLLAWAHLATLALVGAGHLLNSTLQHGMVWYIFSMSIITVNDIAAYMSGFFFGSTPLIVLSPKKTVEGFIGGGIVTVLMAPLYANFLQQFPSITCPVGSLLSVQPCTTSQFYTGTHSDFVLHSLVISLFASIFGPVAGFFCSGFKRACNCKNFGCLIPGHGGVLDRCDCMFLMAVFTYVYLNSVLL